MARLYRVVIIDALSYEDNVLAEDPASAILALKETARAGVLEPTARSLTDCRAYVIEDVRSLDAS